VCSGVRLWRLVGGEADCSSVWLTLVYFMMNRFVLFNGSRDSVVPICIRGVGMCMLVGGTELTADNRDRICTDIRYVWVLI
jgi:hypothetical protein